MPPRLKRRTPPKSPVLWIGLGILLAGFFLWPFWSPRFKRHSYPPRTAPSYPLFVADSIEGSLPQDQETRIEKQIRREKRSALYPNKSLLPALEIVRQRLSTFQESAQIAGMDERLFQGLIVLECGGKPDAIDYMFRQGRGKRAHIGLGQIGWMEGRDAGLKVAPQYEARFKAEVRHSFRLTRMAQLQAMRGKPSAPWQAAFLNSLRRQSAIIENWRRADERFDPDKNLRAAARLLHDRVAIYNGDVTLAIASYHAGGGNIGKAIRLAKKTGQFNKSSTYWDLYKDRSGPVYRLMNNWSDDSRNYLLKVLAAGDIVEKYLNSPDEFRDEYLFWGPKDAMERLASASYEAVRVPLGRSEG